MRISSSLIVAAAVLAGCAGLDKPGLETYEDVRAAIVVSTDPATGVVTASSQAAAKEEVEISNFRAAPFAADGSDGGSLGHERERATVFVQAERRPDGTTEVYVMQRMSYPVFETELQAKPWPETDPDRKGFVGDPWRELKVELVEFRHDCPKGRMICTRYRADRFPLTAEDVRALLSQGKEQIRVSFHDWKSVDWRLDADELRAVLDALGVAGNFR